MRTGAVVRVELGLSEVETISSSEAEGREGKAISLDGWMDSFLAKKRKPEAVRPVILVNPLSVAVSASGQGGVVRSERVRIRHERPDDERGALSMREDHESTKGFAREVSHGRSEESVGGAGSCSPLTAAHHQAAGGEAGMYNKHTYHRLSPAALFPLPVLAHCRC